MIDFSFPENDDGEDRPAAEPEPPPGPPWRADLLILLAAALAALGAFLFDVWQRTRPETMI